jgi:hypothetical protein
MTASRFEQTPPDLVLRPRLPDDITVLTGFGRGEEAIRAGVEETEAALAAIRSLLGDSETEIGS